MEPRIQYVKTPDGVNLAYYEMGAGVPLVFAQPPFSHLTAEREAFGSMFDSIAATARLVRFDHRGFGMSDRSPEDVSLDAYVQDLETIFDCLDLPPCVLYAGVMSPPIAVTYAARHPERLTHLILISPVARPTPSFLRQANAALAIDDDWRFGSEAFIRLNWGWDKQEASTRIAELFRESVTLEFARRALAEQSGWDITGVLDQVRTPTLVVSGRTNRWSGLEAGKEVAAGLPNAQLAVVDDTDLLRYPLEVALAIRSFLGVPDAQPVPLATFQTTHEVGTTIVMFADIADSTALTERLGDLAFRAKARELDESLRSMIRREGGNVVDAKTLGDGVLATFPSASHAMSAAIASSAIAERIGLLLHVGVHAGDVIREAGNVFGGAVNIAARISAVSEPGEVLVSEVVRALARTSAGVQFDDRGEHQLKGVEETVRIFGVRRGA